MRLTLRTLLAYLDDTLDPSEIKQIGQKVAESDTAQELIARIKQVTRRRRLTTPPLTGPGVKWDPNTVAEYLDNELGGEQVAEVEKACLDSDVHLAEIAACHGILTLVVGEPALVPPTARERMYALVKGREAVAARKPRAAAPAGQAAEDDEDGVLGLPAGAQGAWVRWALPVAGVFLFLALGAAVFLTLLNAPRGARPDPVTAADADKSRADKANDDDKPGDADRRGGDQTQHTDPPSKDGWNWWLDAMLGPGYKPPEDVRAEVLPGKPNMEVAELGRYRGGPPGVPSVLAQRQDNNWRRLAPNGPVLSGQTLVSLPGYTSEVALDGGVGLVLRGHVKELTPPAREFAVMDYELESSVILHKNPECDADLTLNQGRIYLTNQKRNGPARVRLRFRPQEVWDLTLEPESQLGVVLNAQYTRNLKYLDEEPRVEAAVCLLEGKGSIKIGYDTTSLDKPCGFFWDNKGGGVTGPLYGNPPALWDQKPPDTPNAVRTLADLKDLADKLPAGPGLAPALRKVLNDEKAPLSYKRVLAVYCLSAIDEVRKLLDVLGDEDPEHGLDRDAAIFALRRWIGRSLANGRALYDPQKKTGYLKDAGGYSSTEAAIILTLLHDYKDSERRDKETYGVLVGYMRTSDKVAIRELAYWQLVRLAGPVGRDVPFEYDPAGQPANRTKAVDEWKKLLDAGKLPPGPPPAAPPPMGMGVR